MLPLWIIDITNRSVRRDEFVHLVGQIEHVFISKNNNTSFAAANGDQPMYHSNEGDNNKLSVNGIGDICDTDTTKSKIISDKNIISEEERKATRNAKLKGNYWYYSSYVYDDYFVELKDSNCVGQLTDTAERLYKFQEALVKDAKDFVAELRRSNAKPYQPINIVVLGDVTESLTQLVFSSIAAILQKEKGRFLTGHIHQGMGVIGMLYVPCDVNARDIEQRKKALRLLREIDVQHNIASIRGYDNMMLYQDVQNRTECTYQRLTDREVAEYLVQCLVHMYLACDINHPLFSGTGSDDAFYFSMGASSIYFDMTVEDKIDANIVASELVNIFKENGDFARTEVEISLLDMDNYKASQLVTTFNVGSVDFEDYEGIRKPFPHPISNFLHRNLKRLYYEFYLRFFPAELLRDTMQKVEDATNKHLEEISVTCNKVFNNVESAMPGAIRRVLMKVNKNVGGLAFVENKVKDLQESLSKEKKNIQRAINSHYWNTILDRENSSFDDYHDTYIADIRSKNSGAGCNALKKEVLDKLKHQLSNEQTLLATIVRSLFLGVLCVLGGLPILNAISPVIINLGDVERFAVLWAIFLFILPALIQVICHFFYQRSKRRLIHKLKTYYTHDAYARLANRIESEAESMYNRLIALLDEYLERCKNIRNQVTINTPDPSLKLLFPTSKFNQPLNGGVFDDEPLISKDHIEGSYIKINYKPELVNNISRDQYFILINHFSDIFANLFSGVSLTDSHTRRFDEKEGDYVFVGRDQLLLEKEERWMATREQFNTDIFKCIKENMVPRAYPTIGDKLLQHSKKFEDKSILEYMIAYAATNGEFSTQKDTEYADVKMNRSIDDLVKPYLPIYTTSLQCAEFDEIYKRYIFVTRWKTYDKIVLNRLFPKEDFDAEVRIERVYDAELQAREDEKLRNENKMENKAENKIEDDNRPKEVAEIAEVAEVPHELYCSTEDLSSIILWSVCPDANSNEWINLFEIESFNDAYKARNIFREIMNTND